MEFYKSDVFPVQQACNSLSLTINGSTQNYRPNEVLRELVVSQVHKDALSKIAQPVFNFGDHGFGAKYQGAHNGSYALDDPGVAYGRAEMMQQLSSGGSATVDATLDYDLTRASSTANLTEFFVTFVEPIIIGPLGPWSLLKTGVELSASSPFADFSPMLPMVNNMQISMQFDQDKLSRNLFAIVKNGTDATGGQGPATLTADFKAAQVMCKFVMPPPSHDIRKQNSYAVPSWDVVRYVKNITVAAPKGGLIASKVKAELSYVSLNESPNMLLFICKP